MAKARNLCLGGSFFLLSLKTSTDCEDWGRNKSCHHRAPNNSQPLSEPSSSGLWKKRESGFSLRNDGESGRRGKPCPAALLTALYMTFSLLSFTNRLDLLMWGDRECLEPTQYWKLMKLYCKLCNCLQVLDLVSAQIIGRQTSKKVELNKFAKKHISLVHFTINHLQCFLFVTCRVS